jgi:hypothetical protein
MKVKTVRYSCHLIEMSKWVFHRPGKRWTFLLVGCCPGWVVVCCIVMLIIHWRCVVASFVFGGSLMHSADILAWRISWRFVFMGMNEKDPNIWF